MKTSSFIQRELAEFVFLRTAAAAVFLHAANDGDTVTAGGVVDPSVS